MSDRRGSISRTNAFTLVELMVAIALSTILIGVLAATFQYVTRAYDTSLAKLDATRATQAALERLDRDWGLAVATPDPTSTGVEATLTATPVVVDWTGVNTTLRHDVLSLLILEPEDVDRDGAIDRTRVSRVRWTVEWDAARETGTLVRVASPATVPGAPGLPTLADEVREVVLADVVEVRFQLWMDQGADPDAFREPPPADQVQTLRDRFVYQGADATISSFQLCTPILETLPHLGPGATVRLEDTRAPARFDQGLYTVRLRQVETGTPLPPNRLVLTTPPGDADGGVRYTAAWLPASAHALLDVRTRGPQGPIIRRTSRVLLRQAPAAVLAPVGGP